MYFLFIYIYFFSGPKKDSSPVPPSEKYSPKNNELSLFRDLENFIISESINDVNESALSSLVEDTISPSPSKKRKLSEPKKRSTAKIAEDGSQKSACVAPSENSRSKDNELSLFRDLENFLNSDSISEVNESPLSSPVDDTISPTSTEERKPCKPKKQQSTVKMTKDRSQQSACVIPIPSENYSSKERKPSKPKKQQSTAKVAKDDTQLRGGLTRRLKKRVLPFISKSKFNINGVPVKKRMQPEPELKSKEIATGLYASQSKSGNKSLSFEFSSSDSQESEKENDVDDKGKATTFVYLKLFLI